VKKLAGFTLVETLIAASVALVAGIFLLSILINHSGVYYKENAMVSGGLSLNDAVTDINNQIKQSSSVAVGYPEDTPTYVTSSNTLVLKLPTLRASGPTTDTFDYVVISIDSSNNKILRVRLFPDALSTRKAMNKVLTPLLDSLNFSYLDKSGNIVAPTSASSVGVALKVLAQTGSISSSRTSTTTTSLRNN
jgi:hypothetical protein